MLMEAIRFDYCGRLACVITEILPAKTTVANHKDVSASLTAGIMTFEVDIDVPNPAALASTLPDLVFTQLRGHLDVVREQQGSDDYRVEILQDLLGIASEMQALGYFEAFGASKPILYHTDLMPRNILVQHGTKISSVLDWDGSEALPPVLAHRPRCWLWDSADEFEETGLPDGYDEDVDLMPKDRYRNPGSGKLSEDDFRIKEYVEKQFVAKTAELGTGMTMEQYQDEAHGRGRMVSSLKHSVLVICGIFTSIKQPTHIDITHTFTTVFSNRNAGFLYRFDPSLPQKERGQLPQRKYSIRTSILHKAPDSLRHAQMDLPQDRDLQAVLRQS
ncbi:hypothetical protein LTS18_003672 [Coniosporium uncinatum]|uniref:Uncharacterized protein n=1 Tax=Coniosporium uncinatum TaxID=93489 RepID=A0ACC3D6H1_9PEZI|nr:hypothetical protein LTS18_003672 [Coniosporium uncinatum]